MNDLPLKIRKLDYIIIDDPYRSNPGCSKVQS